MNLDRRESLRNIAGPVSRETLDGLEAIEKLFLIWAKRINLVSAATLDDVWNRHILDSAQLWPLAKNSTKWLDLGSGGGFPGIVLAFLLKDRAEGHIDLVDSNRKKTAFLQAAVGQFSLPATVHSHRIDEIKDLPQPQIVTARALAPLYELLRLAFPWLSRGAIGFFHKGRDYRHEIQESSHVWKFDLIEHPSKIDPDGAILEIRGIERVG